MKLSAEQLPASGIFSRAGLGAVVLFEGRLLLLAEEVLGAGTAGAGGSLSARVGCAASQAACSALSDMQPATCAGVYSEACWFDAP